MVTVIETGEEYELSLLCAQQAVRAEAEFVKGFCLNLPTVQMVLVYCWSGKEAS